MGLQLETVHMSAMMKKFGGDVSITGILNALRIEIVDSESNVGRKANLGGHGKRKPLAKFLSDKHFEMPAFLCDTFAVMLSMKDVVDFEKDKQKEKVKNTAADAAEDASDSRKKTWNAVMLALDQMETKPTTTKANFSVSCQSITQHVNMSLLRLVHQFVTMIENILKAQHELKDDPMKSCLRQVAYGTSPSIATPSDEYSSKLVNIGYHPGEASGAKANKFNEEAVGKSKDAPPGPRATGSRTEKVGHPSRRPDHLPSLVSVQSGQSPMKPVKGHAFAKTVAEAQGSAVHSPLHSINLSDSIAIDMADTSSPAVAEKTIVDEIKENTPKCWKTLYHLLDLYAMMPVTKTITQSRLSDIEEEPDKASETHSVPFPKDETGEASVETAENSTLPLSASRRQPAQKSLQMTNVLTQGRKL